MNIRNTQGFSSRVNAPSFKGGPVQEAGNAHEATIAQGVDQYGVNRADSESSGGIIPPKGRFVDIYV